VKTSCEEGAQYAAAVTPAERSHTRPADSTEKPAREAHEKSSRKELMDYAERTIFVTCFRRVVGASFFVASAQFLFLLPRINTGYGRIEVYLC
jgi:hypothetical protein